MGVVPPIATKSKDMKTSCANTLCTKLITQYKLNNYNNINKMKQITTIKTCQAVPSSAKGLRVWVLTTKYHNSCKHTERPLTK